MTRFREPKLSHDVALISSVVQLVEFQFCWPSQLIIGDSNEIKTRPTKICHYPKFSVAYLHPSQWHVRAAAKALRFPSRRIAFNDKKCGIWSIPSLAAPASLNKNWQFSLSTVYCHFHCHWHCHCHCRHCRHYHSLQRATEFVSAKPCLWSDEHYIGCDSYINLHTLTHTQLDLSTETSEFCFFGYNLKVLPIRVVEFSVGLLAELVRVRTHSLLIEGPINMDELLENVSWAQINMISWKSNFSVKVGAWRYSDCANACELVAWRSSDCARTCWSWYVEIFRLCANAWELARGCARTCLCLEIFRLCADVWELACGNCERVGVVCANVWELGRGGAFQIDAIKQQPWY